MHFPHHDRVCSVVLGPVVDACGVLGQIAEQLAVYQQNLKQKQKQLRAMEMELEMYKGQVGESKREIERVGSQIDTIPKRFVQQAMRSSIGGAGAGVDPDTAALYNY